LGATSFEAQGAEGGVAGKGAVAAEATPC